MRRLAKRAGWGVLLAALAAAGATGCAGDGTPSQVGATRGAAPDLLFDPAHRRGAPAADLPGETTAAPPVTADAGAPPAAAAPPDAAPVATTVTTPVAPSPAPAPVVDAGVRADARATPTPDAAPLVSRVRDVHAKHLKVRVLWAHKVEGGKDTNIGARLPGLADPALAVELGKMDLDADEVTADVMYAHDVKADVIDATEVHCGDISPREAASMPAPKPDPRD